MKRSIMIAAALTLAALLSAPAEARRHKPNDAPTCANPVDVTHPCDGYFSAGLRSLFQRIGRGVTSATPPVSRRGTVLGGRPAACRGIPWCGCWLRLQLGIADTRLNLARAWARIGVNAGGPAAGVIAVWRHHVGRIVAVPGPGRIILLSGNDGHAVRERERSTRGIIAYRRV